MSEETQTFIAAFLVAVTATIFFVRLARGRKKSGCGKGGCACGKPKAAGKKRRK